MPNLVLSRKEGESVVIDNGTVVVTVVEIRGDNVRLSFEAPETVRVDRLEVHERRKGETDGKET